MITLLVSALLVAAPAESPPVFNAIGTADGGPVSGRIVQMSSGFAATIQDGNRERTIRDVISLRRSDRVLPPPPIAPQLITTTGDRIAGTLLGGDAQSLKFLPSGVKTKNDEPWKVPLASATVLWLTAIPADTSLDPARYDWLVGNRNRDVVRFRNGDVNAGTLAGLDPDTADAQFKYRSEQGTTRTLHGVELAAVGFNPTLSRSRKPKGAYARVILADGSRLALATPSIDSGVLVGETLFGAKIAIPLVDVLSLDVMLGKAVYLSDLRPKRIEQTSFLGVLWPWLPDRTVRNQTLRLMTPAGESTFDKGLGTHPRTVLSYDLGGKYQRFEAMVGLDPEAKIRGRASLHIVVDGKEQEISGLPNVTGGNAIAIRIDLKGAKELVLTTDFGTSGGVGADVNWCDARLVE